MDDIKEKIKWFISSCLGVDKNTLFYDTPLDEGEIVLDSIDFIDLIGYIDQEFNVNMSNVASSNFKNIDTIAEYIKNNLDK